MSYKDEYEVARLHAETGFLDELRRNLEGDFKVAYHLAPPFLSSGVDARGRRRKRRFGAWIQAPLRLLARMKGLRGASFDVFGYSSERRMERKLIGWCESLVEQTTSSPRSGGSCASHGVMAPVSIPIFASTLA